ncbi:MAG TPA: YihY/virulence factor BrkB family protein [Terriglobales bacterium]|nr:YihY/virulence factor BrkB family protein [Terriglobales bacterium]
MTIRQFGRALRAAYAGVNNSHTTLMAAGLAYYFLLSLFPLLVVLASVAPFLPVPDLWDRALWTMSRVVPADAMGVVRRVLDDVLRSGHPRLLSVGLLGTFWAASGGFSSMIEALNVAYDVPETRSWFRTHALAALLTVVIGTFFVVALAAMIVGPHFGAWLADKLGLDAVWRFAWNYARWAVAIAFTVLGVELLYYLAPNVRQKFDCTLPGATFAVVVWIGASYLLGLYIQRFAHFNKTYGTLGAAIALPVWFYVTNLFILIGAEVNSELLKAAGAEPPHVKTGPEPEEVPRAA